MLIVNVQLVLNCEREQAADAINEILREQQDAFVEHSCLVDYAFENHAINLPTARKDYEEGDAFTAMVAIK